MMRRFPHYEILGDANIAKSAAVATRYTDASLRGIIADIHALSRTNYLVCTFSSQVSLSKLRINHLNLFNPLVPEFLFSSFFET